MLIYLLCSKKNVFAIAKNISNIYIYFFFFVIGPNGEPMLVVQGEEFHSQLLPTFIETALQILRQASMISSHNIPEIVLGKNTLTQLSSSKQLSVAKQHLLYPGKVCAYTKQFKKKKNAENTNNSNLNYRKRAKVLIAIADSGHHRIIVCTLQGRVKVKLFIFKKFS